MTSASTASDRTASDSTESDRTVSDRITSEDLRPDHPRSDPVSRRALMVRGGWEGHHPVEATELFVPFLQAEGFEVRREDSPAVYADAEVMAGFDLIIPCVSMGQIEPEELAGLRAAVEAGAGMAGWHGGIVDSYRDRTAYLQLVGGQFVCHPSRHPDEPARSAEPARTENENDVVHTVTVLPEAKAHPITAGIDAFELVTEQYWMLTDDYIDVLATTTQKVRDGDPWHREVTSPAVWTRQWGRGRIAVCTPGHDLEVLRDRNVRTIIERSMLWAARPVGA